jgi:hypothetical protein
MATTGAQAKEFSFSLEQSIEAQSNMFSESVNPRADGAYRLNPSVRLSDRPSSGKYEIRYRPSYTGYFVTDFSEPWDHFLDGTASYRITPVDKVSFNAQLSVLETVRASSLTLDDGSSEVILSNQGRMLQFYGGIGYQRSPNSRSQISLNLDFQDFSYQDSGNVDNRAVSVRTRYTRTLTPKLTLGVSALGRYRMFLKRLQVPSSSSTIVNMNLISSMNVSRFWNFSFAGGPSLILSDQAAMTGITTSRFAAALDRGGNPVGRISPTDPSLGIPCQQVSGRPALFGCPFTQSDPAAGPATASVLNDRLGEQVFVDFLPGQRPGSERSERFTYFMNLSITRTLERGQARLSYSREEEASGGSAASSIRDSVSMQFTFRPSEMLGLGLNAGWNRTDASAKLAFRVVEAFPSGLFSDPDPNNNTIYELAEAGGLIPGETRSARKQSQVWVRMTATRRIQSRISVGASFDYRRQIMSSANGLRQPLIEDFTGSITFNYKFESYVF